MPYGGPDVCSSGEMSRVGIPQRRWFRLVASAASLSVVLLAAPALAQRVDLALSEGRVRVEAGGPPVPLKLAGRAVAEVRSITVLLGGEPVKDVRAELGPAEKTVRPLRITAGLSARPSREYRLRADVSGRMVALDAVIEVTAPARSAAPVLPLQPRLKLERVEPPARITQGPPAPTITRVQGASVIGQGYVIVGTNFGLDRARVQVFENDTPAPANLIILWSPESVQVTRNLDGTFTHKVVVDGRTSNVVTHTHVPPPPPPSSRNPASRGALDLQHQGRRPVRA